MTYLVQVGRYSKGAYVTRYSVDERDYPSTPWVARTQAWWYYVGINIGKGYKKRLLCKETKQVLVRDAS